MSVTLQKISCHLLYIHGTSAVCFRARFRNPGALGSQNQGES